MVFRAPSEHTFEGRHMDLELQFAHRNPEDFNPETDLDGRGLHGKAMILSVFFDRLHGGNEDNSFIESIAWDKEFSENESFGEHWSADPSFDVQTFMSSLYMDMDKVYNFIHYQGSLTIPPCSEGVEWNLLAKVLPISDKQIDALIRKTKANHKGSQGNNRKV